MQTLSNLNRPTVISDSPGRTGYHSNRYESCFAVVPKHRKYRVYTNQNDCTSTTGLLLNRDSQLELLLTECFENRSFIWISTSSFLFFLNTVLSFCTQKLHLMQKGKKSRESYIHDTDSASIGGQTAICRPINLTSSDNRTLAVVINNQNNESNEREAY